ncbi:MAG: MHS family MFS transporter [Gammaproteobacteria bacterium]|nr:MAG: MHS family MFS transporter [Gammaproteobacteria bacterium]
MELLFYLMTVFSLGWGTSALGYTRARFLIWQMIGVLFFALMIPVSAAIADRSGRKAMLGAATAGIIAFGAVFQPLFGSGTALGVVAFLCLGLTLMGLTYGPLGTALAELFPTPVRYTGASLAFNLAGILGASVAPYAASWLATNYGLAYVGCYLSAAGPLTLVALLLIPARERQRGAQRSACRAAQRGSNMRGKRRRIPSPTDVGVASRPRNDMSSDHPWLEDLRECSAALQAVLGAVLEAERQFAPPASPLERLHQITNSPEWAWLQPLYRLIADVDHALAYAGDLPASETAAIGAHARELLSGSSVPAEQAFLSHYRPLLQTDPAVAMAHAGALRALRALPPEAANEAERLHARHQWNERRRFLRAGQQGRTAS